LFLGGTAGHPSGLANEEVVQGLCERCGSAIRRRRLEQWMLQITAYADRLLADLERTAPGCDWVFSRQRYWGEPIPVVYCPECGIVPVPEEDLPLVLPPLKKFRPARTGRSPLANCAEWVNTQCPRCGRAATRETDTMPQWAGSSWYFLRYADPGNQSAPAAPDRLKYWLPVDLYVGGAEHATLHLLYARFFTKFLFDIGVVDFDEPFSRYYNQGMVLMNGRRMSKSRGNVVNPDPLVAEYGADALRTYEVFIGAPDEDVEWQTRGIVGVRRFLDRAYRLVAEGVPAQDAAAHAEPNYDARGRPHQAIEEVTRRLDEMRFNTAVSSLMELVRDLEGMLKVGEFDPEVLHGLA